MKNSPYKARTPVQKRGIETKAKIIKAASSLFCEKGFHNINAADIAARAGVATGTFYSYFNDKKEVLVDVLRLFYQEVTEKVLRSSPGEWQGIMEGRKFISSMIKSFYAAHAINPRLHKQLNALILLDKDIEEINRNEERKVISLIKSFMESHREDIRVADLEAAAEMIFLVSDEMIHRIKITGSDTMSERLLKELEDMLCRFLLKEQ